jgi:hypothetical protein
MQSTADLSDRFNPNAIARGYKPVYTDRYQSSTYRLEGYVVSNDGRLWACFGNGAKRLAQWTEAELLEVSSRPELWRERVTRVF